MTDESDVYTYYYETGEHGAPDFDRPIPVSKEQYIIDYLQNAENDPQSLADLYTDFYDFGGIEFLVFRGRLSSAVLVSRSVQKALAEVGAKLRASRDDGSYIVPGWEIRQRRTQRNLVRRSRQRHQLRHQRLTP